MIEQGVTTLLTSDAGVSAIIGNCFYPVILPDQPSYPCATYQVVSSGSDYSLSGAAERWIRLQIDCWGNAYADCKGMEQAIDQVLDGYQGPLSDGSQVTGAFRGVQVDLFEQYSHVFRLLIEYTIHYRPA